MSLMFKNIVSYQPTGVAIGLSLLLLSLPLFVSAQRVTDNSFRWKTLAEGMEYGEWEAPEKSILNDSKISILRLDPQLYKFELLCASEHQRKNRTASEWAGEFGMMAVFNAGMYSLQNGRTSKGYMKNHAHYNNSHLNPAYNVMIAMQPQKAEDAAMALFDLTLTRWDSIRPHYASYSQLLRMIDRDGNSMSWDKRPWQACSMAVCATDTAGLIYFIFARSPYTHQQMIRFMLAMPFALRTTAYLEGGPEASFYINTGDTTIAKYGSYVSRTYENDDNDHFWKIPNVIGIKKR